MADAGASPSDSKLRQEQNEKDAKKLLNEEEERRKTRRLKKVQALCNSLLGYCCSAG